MREGLLGHLKLLVLQILHRLQQAIELEGFLSEPTQAILMLQHLHAVKVIDLLSAEVEVIRGELVVGLDLWQDQLCEFIKCFVGISVLLGAGRLLQELAKLDPSVERLIFSQSWQDFILTPRVLLCQFNKLLEDRRDITYVQIIDFVEARQNSIDHCLLDPHHDVVIIGCDTRGLSWLRLLASVHWFREFPFDWDRPIVHLAMDSLLQK